MDNFIDTVNKILGVKPTEKTYKPSDPYKYRKSYLRRTIVFLLVIFLGFTIPLFINNKNRYITPKVNNTAYVTDGATLKKVQSQYNPDTHLLVSEFFIGDQNNIDNTAEDKNLANIDYAIKYQIQNQKKTNYPTKISRVNDHFMVVETQNVSPGYGILEYDITPKKIKPDLDTDCSNDILNAYVQEATVKQAKGLTVHNAAFYQQIYKDFAINNYQARIKELNQNIKKRTRIIADDNRILAKLNTKLETAFKQDKSDLQDQINDTENHINIQNTAVKANKTKITEYENRINHAAMTYQN